MTLYDELLKHIDLPRFVKVRYEIPDEHVEDIPAEMHAALLKIRAENRIHPGMRIAVTAGSREIGNYTVLLKSLLDELKAMGAQPFLVPAMGSHGGATAEGQREILTSYGITEESMGVPIRATMETEYLGVADNGMEVRMDRYAAEADGIVVMHRIKAHTGFHGDVESGLMKMITIGLGKQHGANICHAAGPFNMSKNIQSIARHAISKKNIVFAVGIVENSLHKTHTIRAMLPDQIFETEKELLILSKKLMPHIPFKKADALFLSEIGKDIAGEGMDPNITGRSYILGRSEPFFESISVLDITDVSHGNGTGFGNADSSTMRAYRKFRMDATYPNCITSRDSTTTKIPVIMPSDLLAFKYALQVCFEIDWKKGPKIVWLKNTLCLNEFYVSEQLLPEVNRNPQLEVIGEPMYVAFDADGNVAEDLF